MTDTLELRGRSFALGDGRLAVPEPAVKAWLSEHAGAAIPVPAGVTVAADHLEPATWSNLREPLVLKAFGPRIIHKSELGAVQLGLTAAGVPAAIGQLSEQLAGRGTKAQGYLIEEQHPGGLELIVGVVRHPGVGPVALLGFGGTLAEILDTSVLRLCPISDSDAEQMIDQLPGTALLAGVPGAAPVDRKALVGLLMSVAGKPGEAGTFSVVEALGDALLEFECNPVVVTPEGVCALDARLILEERVAVPTVPLAPATDFTRLFAPRAIAVAGASTTKVTFGNRFLAAYRAAGWTDGLYALHPHADQIDRVPAVAAVSAIPGGVDYLLAAVPAAACADLVRLAAGAASFVHIVSGGFGETDAAGQARQLDLRAAAREAGLRVLGPNCMGVYSPRGRQTFQLGSAGAPGSVSVLSQSGGLTGDILQAGRRAGLEFAQLASIGNAVDVTAAELLDWLVDDPQTQVIGLYLEGLADGDRLAAALRRARGCKPVVLLVGGMSAQGARAVASHTGAMTSDSRIWQAIAESTGAVLAPTLEDLIGCLVHLQRWSTAKTAAAAPDPRVLVVGPGGGASVLSADAVDRAGLRLGSVSGAAQDELRGLGYGAGTSVANPLEIPLGPATPPDSFARVLDPLLARESFTDILLHVNVASYYGYGPPDLRPLADLVLRTAQIPVGSARVALVLRNAEVASGNDADLVAEACRAARLPTFTSLDVATRAIAAAQSFAGAAA